ncbi:crotonase/enoyl-CoA hydratase family protein [Futiania mangrovi]|uniref:Crotonase/enoyl-CoA hydratase family protein n=1 Tax=Futiania mangrovi TaxID=2959716 RepID=A0A9J6PCJ6_9PROT|nr:crotonase/enoyl-CoA hydratase family protein [Futiania mangrovii]MCP1337956.1 crotonase/enoyl-CoA hydratase family protein [Futiania mangrovii]
MSYRAFRVDTADQVAHVRMMRPEKANALDADMWRELPEIVDSLDAGGTVRAMVLSGEGRHFCSGIDLTALSSLGGLRGGGDEARGAAAMRDLVLALQDSFTAFERARFPVIATIHGACLGGGIDMITACDIRLASADAVFGVEEVNIALAADVGTLQRLPRIVPPGIAHDWCLTGRRFGAEEAARWGLVSEVLPDAEALHARALDLAKELAAKSPLAVWGTKKMLLHARDHTVAEGLREVANWSAASLSPPEIMEAAAARAEKRPGRFADLPPRRKGL